MLKARRWPSCKRRPPPPPAHLNLHDALTGYTSASRRERLIAKAAPAASTTLPCLRPCPLIAHKAKSVVDTEHALLQMNGGRLSVRFNERLNGQEKCHVPAACCLPTRYEGSQTQHMSLLKVQNWIQACGSPLTRRHVPATYLHSFRHGARLTTGQPWYRPLGTWSVERG